ncbi:MAG TPA: hypothetical protein VIX19_17145 [Terriglobales bacterium]
MTKSGLKAWVGAAGRMLLAYALIFAQGAWAGQNPQSQPNTASPEKAGAQSSSEKQASTATTATTAKTLVEDAQGETTRSSAAENKRSGGGAHEGITVHGHWTIEVRNPDGSLVRHIEFENSLDPGFSIPNPTAGQPPTSVVPGGAAYLSGVLSGQWSAPGASSFWGIVLVGASGLNNIAITANAPCVDTMGTAGSLGACIIVPTGTLCGPTPTAGISCNLSVAPLGTTPNFTGIQLSGSVTATQNGQVSTVGTLIGTLACVSSAPNCLPTNVNTASFTSSTNFPGAPIAVIAGQTIAATVNISFS